VPRLLSRRRAKQEAVSLEETQRTWEALAQADPLWAVLSQPDKIGRRWAVDEFLASGEAQVAASLQRFEELGGRFPDRGSALDFGCGVGRLTQPLARRFDRVLGVDISPTMVQVARRLSAEGTPAEFVQNDAPDLRFLSDDSMSLVFTHITLQHVPPEAAVLYLREFLRVVKPSGALIFQLPSHLSERYLPADDQGEVVPPDARLATITATVPDQLHIGEQTPLTVTVRNASDRDWLQTANHPILLGNHWTNADGTAVAWDDGRARLPVRLAPGETAELVLPVTPPGESGTYRLLLDVVQEGSAWFAEWGSPMWEQSVSVMETPRRDYEGGDFGELLARPSTEAPGFEMHGIPIATVKELLADHGARLLGADEWVDEWHSFSYFVQAAP
jgi:SAM-dependent methyltransferase